MPRREGQAKVTTGEDLKELTAKAIGGTFAGDDAYKLIALTWAQIGHAQAIFDKEHLNWAYDRVANHFGREVLNRAVNGDRKFFRQLAKVIDAFPSPWKETKDNPFIRDPVLYHLCLLKDYGLKPDTGEWTVGLLVDALAKRGVKCARDDVRSRAKLIGLKLDTKRGRRPGKRG